MSLRSHMKTTTHLRKIHYWTLLTTSNETVHTLFNDKEPTSLHPLTPSPPAIHLFSQWFPNENTIHITTTNLKLLPNSNMRVINHIMNVQNRFICSFGFVAECSTQLKQSLDNTTIKNDAHLRLIFSVYGCSVFRTRKLLNDAHSYYTMKLTSTAANSL